MTKSKNKSLTKASGILKRRASFNTKNPPSKNPKKTKMEYQEI